MRKITILSVALLCSTVTGINNNAILTEQILDNVTNEVTLDLKETTSKLKEIVDYTTSSGKLSLFRALRGKRRSRKTIKTTTNQVEQKINNAIQNIEQEKGKQYPDIRKKTGTFIAATKNDVYAMHKKMTGKMRKLIGVQQAEIVQKKVNKAKNKINKFEQTLLVKVAKLKSELQHDLER